ncbi:glycosyl hydrolase, partial [Klebsiella pneumoniae]
LRDFLQRAHAQFQLPIWLTEYSLTQWVTGGARFPGWQQQAAFAGKSVAMLNSLSYVERYAWFSLTKYTALWEENSNLV